jgi:hypothetical protein
MESLMQEYMQIFRELVTEPSVISVRFQRIHNFHKLIVDELPYGQIDPSALVQGLIEFDGPAQDPTNNRKPLQWYFGGTPYEVCKAIRIQYSYQKYLDGVQLDANGSLFIGYESALDSPYYMRARETEDAEYRKGIPDTIGDLLEAYRNAFRDYPGRATALARYVTTNVFDDFVEENIPDQSAAATGKIKARANAKAATSGSIMTDPTPLSKMLEHPRADGLPGARIEYDGPARGYYSHKAFPYTTDTLFNEPSGLYNSLLWWYFGGRAFRITKAMRLRYSNGNDLQGALLVGYQGPGPS